MSTILISSFIHTPQIFILLTFLELKLILAPLFMWFVSIHAKSIVKALKHGDELVFLTNLVIVMEIQHEHLYLCKRY